MNLKTLLENAGPKDCKKCLFVRLCKDKKSVPTRRRRNNYGNSAGGPTTLKVS